MKPEAGPEAKGGGSEAFETANQSVCRLARHASSYVQSRLVEGGVGSDATEGGRNDAEAESAERHSAGRRERPRERFARSLDQQLAATPHSRYTRAPTCTLAPAGTDTLSTARPPPPPVIQVTLVEINLAIYPLTSCPMDRLPPPRIDLLVHAQSPAAYRPVLEQLLEPSQPLSTLLAPQLHARVAALPPADRPKSYAELIDLARQTVDSWDVEDQAAFLAAHPRIGETKGLSQASAGEQAPQQGQQATPAQVLKRLQVRCLRLPHCSKARTQTALLTRTRVRDLSAAGPQFALRGRLSRIAVHHLCQRPLPGRDRT